MLSHSDYLLERFVHHVLSEEAGFSQGRQLIVRAVNGVGNTLDESLDKLKLFTQERINEVQKITLREMDLLQNQYPEKWKNLDSLAYLETMNRHLQELKQGTVQQGDRMDREFRELNSSFDRAVMELGRINMYNEHRVGSRVSAFFQKIGRKKKELHADGAHGKACH